MLRKVMFFSLLLVTSLVLVGCKKEEKTKELSVSDLKDALSLVKENYELEVEVLIYDEEQANVTVLRDGNKSMYKEGEFVEIYYVREGSRDLTVIEKKGDHFEKSTTREPIDKNYHMFNRIDSEWFNVVNEEFVIHEDNHDDFLAIFDFSSEISLKNVKVKLDEDLNLSSINIQLEENRDDYYLNIVVKNIGETEITLPEVA